MAFLKCIYIFSIISKIINTVELENKNEKTSDILSLFEKRKLIEKDSILRFFYENDK